MRPAWLTARWQRPDRRRLWPDSAQLGLVAGGPSAPRNGQTATAAKIGDSRANLTSLPNLHSQRGRRTSEFGYPTFGRVTPSLSASLQTRCGFLIFHGKLPMKARSSLLRYRQHLVRCAATSACGDRFGIRHDRPESPVETLCAAAQRTPASAVCGNRALAAGRSPVPRVWPRALLFGDRRWTIDVL